MHDPFIHKSKYKNIKAKDTHRHTHRHTHTHTQTHTHTHTYKQVCMHAGMHAGTHTHFLDSPWLKPHQHSLQSWWFAVTSATSQICPWSVGPGCICDHAWSPQIQRGSLYHCTVWRAGRRDHRKIWIKSSTNNKMTKMHLWSFLLSKLWK